MIKLKLKSQVKFHKIFFLFLLFFTGANRVLSQTSYCSIDNYLLSSKKNSHPDITMPDMGKINVNFKKQHDYVKKIKFHYMSSLFNITRYEFGKGLFVDIGKGKIEADSIFYINFYLQHRANFYFLKSNSISIIPIGYLNYNTEASIYFKLKSETCEILFDINSNSQGFTITQYDR